MNHKRSNHEHQLSSIRLESSKWLFVMWSLWERIEMKAAAFPVLVIIFYKTYRLCCLAGSYWQGFTHFQKFCFSLSVHSLTWCIPDSSNLLHELFLILSTKVVLGTGFSPEGLASEDFVLEVSVDMDDTKQNHTTREHSLQNLSKEAKCQKYLKTILQGLKWNAD